MKQYKNIRIPGNPVFIRMTLILLVILLHIENKVYAQDELNIIKNKWLEYTDAPNALYHHLTGQIYELLKQREDSISKINTLTGWQKRQKWIHETLMDIAGPFPIRTPLNAKVVNTISKESYRIEHVIFESQPGFYVTSSLFLPSGLKKGMKAPAIIYCSGHSADGYRNPVYIHVILNLVKKGFIVFAFDPVGQGERLEYYDIKTGKSFIGGPTSEHSYSGAQSFITGSSQAKHMIWDGIRAVDYLLSRKEVDPSRIGITGRSGGGTQSAYIAAVDDRIYASAPENYITNYTRLLQSIGPQDAEQNLLNLIKRGLDHPDFLIVRAPRPTMMITTTGDMFSIQGARETEKEVYGIYKAYGKEENFSRIEDDAAHESTLKNREALYAFFQKHLNNPGSQYDEKTQALTIQELQVTKTGQVSTSLDCETVFSINLREAGMLASLLDKFRHNPDTYLPDVISSAKELSGYLEPLAIDEPVFCGRILKETYIIEKCFVKGEGDYVIPYLLFKPKNADHRTLIYLHPSGKSAEAFSGGEIERFVKNGITVLAPDLIGTGEMGPGALRGDAYFEGVSHNLWYASMLSGRTIAGIQAGDVVRLVRLLRKNNRETMIYAFARKEMAPVLLHAAAFNDEICSLILFEPYTSYMSVVINHYYNPVLIPGTVPGALRKYDLPDLAAAFAPRKIFIAGATDATGSVSDTNAINKDLEVIKTSYMNHKADGNLVILTGKSLEHKYDILMKWIE